MPSSVAIPDTTGLASWSTLRLLAFRDRLLRCEQSVELSDLYEEEIAGLDPARIHFKSDPRWSELYQAVKMVLSGREHVP